MAYKDPEARKAYRKAYKAANKDKVAAEKKAYYMRHRTRLLAEAKVYREANKEKIYAQTKAYQAANRESCNQYAKIYQQKRIAAMSPYEYESYKKERREHQREWYANNKERINERVRKYKVTRRLRRRLGIANPPEVLVELICAHNDLRRLIDEKCK